MKRAGQLDPATWVDEHGDALFRYALLRLRDRDRAEDLVQETLLAALAARERFDDRSTERTWLIGILKHKVWDDLRKVGREQPAGAAGIHDDPAEEFFTKAGTWRRLPRKWRGRPDQEAETREFWQVFYQCLDALPRLLGLSFVLRELDGLSTDKICEDLNITPANLWTSLHRARLRLRSCIEARWFGLETKAGRHAAL